MDAKEFGAWLGEQFGLVEKAASVEDRVAALEQTVAGLREKIEASQGLAASTVEALKSQLTQVEVLLGKAKEAGTGNPPAAS